MQTNRRLRPGELRIDRPRGAEEVLLKPGIIIVHVAMEPDTNTVTLYRSERAIPPRSPQEAKVEMDNWFTLLINALALMMSRIEHDLQVPWPVLEATVLNVFRIFRDSGGASGKAKKIVIETGENGKGHTMKLTDKENASKVKFNYDAEIESLGFKKLSDQTYIEYCSRVGLSDRDKNLIPLSQEFNNCIIFRKELQTRTLDEWAENPQAPRYYLEVAREKVMTPNPALDAKASKYLVAMVVGSDELQRKFYWQITQPERTKELLEKIEEEAKKIAGIYL